MNIILKNRRGISPALLFLLCFFAVCFSPGNAFATPPLNDSCSQATLIAIPAGGYGLGTFTAAQTDMTSATVQAGETFAPAIFVAGLDKKSTWYRFSIPTIRAVRVTLSQPGTTITAGDVGFAVYKANSCVPGNADISAKLTPIVTFGNTYHPCVPSGEYLIQVSSNANANGPISVQVEISDQTGAAYDHPNQAYAFGTAGYYAHKIDFSTECQSIEDATEVCNAFTKATDYNKTAWLTFTTPAYFDYVVVQLSGTGTSTYFPSNNNQAIKRKFGYSLYKGDAVTTPIGSLTTISGCDSIETDGYYAAYKVYKCSDLLPNTTYSIQLFIQKDFGDDVRLGILVGGQVPTKGPKPMLSAIPAPNAIGNLAASPNGTLTQLDEVWGCNSRHNTSVCGPALPDSGILFNGIRYNLSSFFTFTLTTTCAVSFNGYVTQCGPQPLIRIFKQGVTNSCTGLDTANIVGSFVYNGSVDCLPPGNYTVQVSGQDYTDYFGRFNYGTPGYNAEQCLSNNLGASFKLDIRGYTRKAANKFSLDLKGAVDSINVVGGVMLPLLDGVGYQATSDTMGCQNTLRPIDTTCSPLNNKVIYREFNVGDSGVVDFATLTYPGYSAWKYRMYSGDASALAFAQNVSAYPDKVSGLVAKTECLDYYTNCNNKKACVLPGTYTFATMGGDADVGRVDQPTFTFQRIRTKHNSPATAQNLGSIMDTLGANGGTIVTDVDDWSCTDNAVAINGYVPCSIGGLPATKAIYRQFYLKDDAIVRIDNIYYYYCMARAYGTKTLFYGKATDGLAGLTPVGGGWNCFQAAGSAGGCELLKAGWYTVVSYNQGPSYDDPTRSLNLEGRYNSSVGYNDEFKIIITPTCPSPQFNRPHKASVDNAKQPFLITWGDRPGGSPAYPKRDSVFALPTEHFNCIVDTPFANHPIKSCQASSNRVAYYVFKTTQVSFLQINAGGYYAALYDKDVRVDSAQFNTLTPLQPCNNAAGYIQYCFFQPGTYTLVIFAGDADVCKSVTPTIYIDEIGYSRFDYAKNAYDFGVVPPDSAYHYGKVGDVNPINSGRQPSHDYFYCTTGASTTDPTNPVCYTTVNPNVYNNGPNKPLYDSVFPPSQGVTRRNLWYTFVADQPGYVKVRVEAKAVRKEWQPKFSVYQSDVDASLPFSTVVSTGQVDSTVAQGLTHIVTNQQNWYYCANLYNDVSFYRDPCTSIPTRYYILVESINGEPYEAGGSLPNTQQEISIMIDSVNLVLPKHDHYSQAGDLGTVGVGTFTGDVDNYSCATKDPTDPIYYYNNSSQCQKTLWYKFTANITGNVRYRIHVNNTLKQDYYDVQLFRQTIPGDSTSNGLQVIGYNGVYGADNTYWAQTCVFPGTYYLLLPGCDQVRNYVYPEIELIEATGDFCSRPVTAVLNGAGAVSSTVLVNCHTIATDYGEFGPQLTCPPGANTADYKSSWFRMDIGGTDTLDVTTYLVENTNASSSDIKYRLMTGNCGAMQEQSCVLDALTQNTYQCLVPGQSYYVQVFTPVTKFNQSVTGTIDLKLSAIAHKDTCAPLTNCLANANFTSLFNCNVDDSVKFVNYSTYGTSISYKWDFGSNKTSPGVSPSFFYPVLPTDQTYSVKLVVENTSCGKKDSAIKSVTIPGRPYIKFGNDIARCDAAPITLSATSHPGATYLWQNGSTADTFRVTATGNNDYSVKVSYNGCSSRDTIKVVVSPISPRPLQNIILCTDSVSVSANRGYGETYKWSNGSTASSIFLSKPGFHWVDIKYFTCTYRDSFFVNSLATARPLGNDTSICITSKGYLLNARTAGATSYKWQDGSTADTLKVTTSGQYSVTINFPSCIVRDTIVISTSSSALLQSVDTTMCAGSSIVLPWGKVADSTGSYSDTVRYASGCDSLVRTVKVFERIITKTTTSPVICAGQAYTLSSGALINTTGIYNDTLRYVAGCDSLINTVNLSVKATATSTLTPIICQGQTYTLPSGLILTTAGTYRDTLHYTTGCDSVRTTVTLTVKAVAASTLNPSICQGQSYTLPSGIVVTGAGIYKDTLRYASGCDSVRNTINLSVKALTRSSYAAAVCAGQSYTLPSGKVVNTTAIYSDTLRYATSCDSVINTINLTVKTVTRKTNSASICAGQTFALPSGKVVNATGVYNDTISYSTGCDSLITVVNLIVKTVTRQSSSASICAGQSYTLPSGKSVNTAGTYIDTVKYNTGCDSLISTITLSVKAATKRSLVTSICAGQTYLLPSGVSVNTTGIYNDTLRYTSGCDSVITTVNLSVKTVTQRNTSASICAGATYTLPSGKVVSTGGNYNDTLRYATGCDSLITLVNLVVKNVTRQSLPASICAGQSYTLPSGKSANSAGTYIDTVKYSTGCDSLISTITLSVKAATKRSLATSICAGQTYLLPSGVSVSIAGIYNDTLRYASGCDSLITTVTLSVKAVTRRNTVASICAGAIYTLPSGKVVSTAGNYNDTLRYATGCDSLITVVNLAVKNVTRQSSSTSICAGQSYTLPSGRIVSNAGTYLDTVKYISNCDSLISTITLSVKTATRSSLASSICAGQSYMLPSGASVNTAGIYSDTLRYASGCDSVITTINLVVKAVARVNTSAAICSGQTYSLPSGAVVNATGTYRDTLRYASGCDSVITTLALQVRTAKLVTISPDICPGETYTFPSGGVVSAAGNYTDIIKGQGGCDSIITTIRLSISPNPVVSLIKSNDIDCILGSATLTASGGSQYLWSPAQSLSNPTASSPVANPSTTTFYKVQVTSSRGCVTTDSIQVIVNKGDASSGYLVASAFTPNNDGKNDCFGVKSWGAISELDFSVFHRNGQLMFHTSDPSKCWDGTYAGIKVESGAYVYQVSANTICGRVFRKGTVVLIR